MSRGNGRLRGRLLSTEVNPWRRGWGTLDGLVATQVATSAEWGNPGTWLTGGADVPGDDHLSIWASGFA